jgi:hypothetical protein
MHKRVTVKSLLTAAVAGASLLLIAAPAFALPSVPASVGATADPANAGCIILSSGSILNICNKQVGFYIPLDILSPGGKVAFVATNNPGTGTFSCSLSAMSQNGAVTTGPAVFPNGGNQISSVTVTVPSGGSMVLFCDIDLGGKIYNVNYTQ